DDLVLMFRDIVRDQDLLRQLCIGRRNKEDLPVEAQLADNCISRALLDRHDSAFRTSFGFAESDLDLHLVAVHCRADQRGRYKNVATDAWDFFFGNDESIPVA